MRGTLTDMSTFTIYGQRYHAYEAIVDAKTKEVIDDGQPKRVRLAQWSDKKVAESMAENIKSHCQKRSWKIWIE